MGNRENKKYGKDEVVVRALRPFGTTIFTEMTVLSDNHGAINLSQGFPDFDGPEEIKKRAAEAITIHCLHVCNLAAKKSSSQGEVHLHISYFYDFTIL